MFALKTRETQKIQSCINLLPTDGEVYQYGKIFEDADATSLCTQLLETTFWQYDVLIIFGKKITTKRKVAYYGDEPFLYKYSGITKSALPWTEAMLYVKRKVESISQETFNACLLNLYHSGEEGMGWHSDDEAELQTGAAIASVSFGAERRFDFKHKVNGTKVSTILPNGSMLIMKGGCQQMWKHRLPPSKKILAARINLTFRKMQR